MPEEKETINIGSAQYIQKEREKIKESMKRLQEASKKFDEIIKEIRRGLRGKVVEMMKTGRVRFW
jgi:ABC-type Fe3+-citrate transport system substrate-binding protein